MNRLINRQPDMRIFCLLCCLAVCLLFLPIAGQAQADMSRYSVVGRGGVGSTFVTDYLASGINPANVALEKDFRDPVASFGLLQGGGSFYTESFKFFELMQVAGQSFDIGGKRKAVEKLADKETSGSGDVIHLGLSVRIPKINTAVAFTVQDYFQGYGRLNRNAAELLFLGRQASYFNKLELATGQIINNPYPDLPPAAVVRGFSEQVANYSSFFDGTRISGSWYRAWTVSAGYKLLETYKVALYLGVGVKLLQGMASVDIKAENGQLAESSLALSPSLGISMGDSLQDFNPSFAGVDNPSSFMAGLVFPEPAGSGSGLDLGLHLTLFRNVHLAVALNNFGRMRWRGNAYRLPDIPLEQFGGSGFNSFNVLNFNPETFNLSGAGSPVQWEGTQENIARLPGLWRFGLSYDWVNTLHAGFEAVLPANRVAGNLEQPFFALGCDFWLTRAFKFQTGLNTGGNSSNKVNWSAGLAYHSFKRNFEAGLAFRDMTTFFNQSLGSGSTLSLSGGFLRFKI